MDASSFDEDWFPPAGTVDVDAALAEYDAYVEGQTGPGWGDELITSGAVVETDLDAVEAAARAGRAAVACQYGLMWRVIREAMAFPDPWCGPDPTRDPGWTDPRGRDDRARARTVSQLRDSRVEFAERAAVCDLAVRLRLSERMIRSRAETARTLIARCPRTWEAFCDGDIDERNADTTASLADTLPDEDPLTWERFDTQAADAATTLTPGKFRVHARAVRERLHPESIDTRHHRAATDRYTWLAPELDGMATLSVYGPATALHAAHARVDDTARHLHGQAGETRTLAQLRTDVTIALLHNGTTTEDTGGDGPAGSADTGARVGGMRMSKPAIAITVPVLTLLGHGDEPAVLDGYGPIDTATARNLAGDASSWVRILTHPITGTTLNIDRTSYRTPKALRRWLGIRDKTCIFPGCGRLARDCDIDHKTEWHDGGTTNADNLGPECEHHHQVKTETRWHTGTDPDTGATRWISPTGAITDTDPPPW